MPGSFLGGFEVGVDGSAVVDDPASAGDSMVESTFGFEFTGCS